MGVVITPIISSIQLGSLRIIWFDRTLNSLLKRAKLAESGGFVRAITRGSKKTDECPKCGGRTFEIIQKSRIKGKYVDG